MSEKRTTPDTIKQKVQRVLDLPTLPTVVSKMLQLIDSRRSSAGTLARLISTDQVLTAKLLKLANSAYYGYTREISTINMAVIILGFNTVKELVLGLSVFDAFKNNAPESSAFDAVKLWEHSAACGVATRMLSKNCIPRYTGEAFVAGLLHDMGKMILSLYFEQDLNKIIEYSQENSCALEEAEENILGVTHGQVGAWLAERWNLPPLICNAIKHHHDPWNAKSEPAFVALVTVADILCHQSYVGHSGRPSAPCYDERLWNTLHKASVPIDEPDIANLQVDFLLEYGNSEAYVSVVQDESLLERYAPPII